MNIIRKVADIRAVINQYKREGKSVGFVPTMGFLHQGHLSLVHGSKAENDITVVSIFVNPTQFGPNEDLDAYPRNFEGDSALLEGAGVDILFYPEAAEMYSPKRATTVSVSGITETLCGASRPGHFDGVALVVTKLFNIVAPDRAYFGQKDYQQLQVIKRFTEDLNIPVKVIGMPIVREEDGLALSSRNVYLKPEERESALSLSRSFGVVREKLAAGVTDTAKMTEAVSGFIAGFPHTAIDYVSFVDPESLQPVATLDKAFVMALAVKVGKARLIDNNLFEI